jgi:plasmid stabilization system protein ParE
MGYKIVWTSEAENDFKQIVRYITENWSEQSALKFINNVYKKLDYLILMPSSIRTTENLTIRMYNLDKQNALFFTIKDDLIILLSIYPYKRDTTRSKYY